jgi:hypothetical protein
LDSQSWHEFGCSHDNEKEIFKLTPPSSQTLVFAAFASTFFIATFANKGSDYWTVTNPISPGHTISASDIKKIHVNLNQSANTYMSTNNEPIGMVAKRQLHPNEIIANSDLTNSVDAMSTSAVPISVRGVDLATGLMVGEGVDIYWVLDTQNGESAVDPILILGGVTLLSYDKGGNNFGSDIGITVAVEETQVLRLLSATTMGRLVVVRSHV